MSQIVKQVVGIDCAMSEHVATLKTLTLDQDSKVVTSKTFTNTVKGVADLRTWANKHGQVDQAVEFVLEATGVYHQELAEHLFDNQELVSIVLPNKISAYTRSLNLKTINDHTIAEFGLRHKLEYWEKPDQRVKNLRDLMRERSALIDQRTVCKNELHALNAAARPNFKSIARLKKRIKFFNSQVDEIELEARDLSKSSPEFHKSICHLCTIPGVGELTAWTIVGETFGFNLFHSSRQLVSYAGLDIRIKDSETQSSTHSLICTINWKTWYWNERCRSGPEEDFGFDVHPLEKKRRV